MDSAQNVSFVVLLGSHINLFDTKFLCERNIIQNGTPQQKTACFTVFNSCAALVTSLKSFWVLAIIVYCK